MRFPESHISRLSPDGYVNCRGYGFLKNWGIKAVEYNPELIYAVKRCNHPETDVPAPVEGAPVEAAAFWGMHLMGLAFCYSTFRTEEIKQAGDDLVQQILQARGDDGYLGSHEMNDRLGGDGSSKEVNWDVWGQYLAIYGLYQWYRITGNQDAKRLALEGTEVCLRHFNGKPYTAGFASVATSMSHMYALLYQETGDEKYLAEAMRILEKDWPANGDWLNEIEAGKACYQFKLNRWEILHVLLLLGTMYEITEEQRYFRAFEQVWWSVLKLERHNTGAITSREIMVGSPYQAGAIETCCSIGWIAYSLEYLRYSRNSYVADEIELTYYNAIMGALMDGLREVSYDNPMEGYRVKSQVHLTFNYNAAAPDMNCCQANACRGIGEVSRWAAMADEQALYLNYYGPCTMQTKTPGGQEITLRIQGEYPVSGRVTINVEGMATPEKFTLQLRVPCWSAATEISVCGMCQDGVVSGQYYPVEKVWDNGDQISLSLDKRVHFWAGEEAYAGRTAVYYGPLLMALDMDMNQHRLLPNTVLTQEELRNASLQPGDGFNQWAVLDVKTKTGEAVRLVDYASAGKTGAFYTTWQRVTPAPAPMTFDRQDKPVWLNQG